jgi:RNA polymerase sigma-70 factor (ECF subfamily)
MRDAGAGDKAFKHAPLPFGSGAEHHFGSMKMNGIDGQPALEDLARDLEQPIRRYLERYVGDLTAAEDLWQETFMRMSKGLSSFAGRSSIKTWAFSIASRVAADYFRHPERKARITELNEVDELIDSGRSIDDRLVVNEMNACVRQVIDGLPQAYREALILHDLEGLSAEQTAEICDCSVASAKIRIHRARSRLRQALKEQCEFYRDPDSVFRCDRKA